MGKPGKEQGRSEGGDSEEGSRVVIALQESRLEARGMLNANQDCQAVQLVKRLADFGDRQATSDLDIRPFGNFWKLRLKGGFIRINLRIYFAFVSDRNEVVVLKVYKKEEDRRTCPAVMLTLEDRLEDYLDGKHVGISTYRRGRGVE